MTAAAETEPLVCSDGWMQGDSQDAQRYDLLGEIATGGMATVYVAKLRGAHGFARTVAVKCMHPQYAKDPSFVDMFLDEARVAAKIRHPNVVPTLDIIQEQEQLLIVLEYVEGETLSAILKSARSKGTKIAAPIACAIVHDLLCGLHAAHEATDDEGRPLDIIHRDVSPQNVIVGVDGLARVLDFGVAKASGRAHETRSGEIKGKVPYMPVEQLYGEDLDRRADVYAAGVVLWEALTGERLFEAPSDAALVLKIAEATIDTPSKRLGVSLPPGSKLQLPEDPKRVTVIPPAFENRLVPRLGVEWRAVDNDTLAVDLRGGYAYERSPFPPQRGATNFVDNDRHAISLGAGLELRDLQPTMDGMLRFDAHFVYYALPTRVHQKTSPIDPVGDYTSGGNQFGFGVQMEALFR